MRWIFPLLLLSLALCLTACRDKKTQLELRQISLTDTVVEEDPGPPEPPYLGSAHRFATAPDWLGYLCDSIKPTPEVVAYYFNMSEYPEGHAVLFLGNRKYDAFDKDWIFYTDDRVQDFYPLPAAAYKGLSQAEALTKFAAELKVFSKTEKFRQSFFARAKAVGAGFDKDHVVLIK